MGLKDLGNEDKIYHIVQTVSQEARVYVRRLMMEACDITSEEIEMASDPTSFSAMVARFGVPPFLTSEWLGEVTWSKGMYKVLESCRKEMTEGYGRYLIFVDNYGDYKRIRELLPEDIVNTVYLSNLNRGDIAAILGKAGGNLTDTLFKELCTGYRGNVDAILSLSRELKNGESIKTKEQLREVCGMPDIDATAMVLSLAKWVYSAQSKYEGIGYEKWRKSVTLAAKPRVKKFLQFVDEKSPQYVRVVIENSLYNFIALKHLNLTGAIRRKGDLDEYESEAYDMGSLKRLKRYYDSIVAIPIDVYMVIYGFLAEETYWTTGTDVINMLYNLMASSVEIRGLT